MNKFYKMNTVKCIFYEIFDIFHENECIISAYTPEFNPIEIYFLSIKNHFKKNIQIIFYKKYYLYIFMGLFTFKVISPIY